MLSDHKHETTYENQAYLTEDQPLVSGAQSSQSVEPTSSSKGSTEKDLSQYAETVSTSMVEGDVSTYYYCAHQRNVRTQDVTILYLQCVCTVSFIVLNALCLWKGQK